MNAVTLVRNFKTVYFGTQLQREIASEFGLRIRQTKLSYPLWEISGQKRLHLLAFYNDFVMFAYRNYFIVDCPNHKWDITKRGNWLTQLILIERIT